MYSIWSWTLGPAISRVFYLPGNKINPRNGLEMEKSAQISQELQHCQECF